MGRLPKLRILPLLACLLIAAASGDDLCLVHLVFPATDHGSDELPPEDPNADFVAVSDSLLRHPEGDGPLALLVNTASSPLASSGALLGRAPTIRPCFPSTAWSIPLRC